MRLVARHNRLVTFSCGLKPRQVRAASGRAIHVAGAGAAAPLVFPHSDIFTIDGREVHAEDVIDLLTPQVTPERLYKMQQVLW